MGAALSPGDEVFCVGLAAEMVRTSKNLGWMTAPWLNNGKPMPAPANDERAHVWLSSICEQVALTQ